MTAASILAHLLRRKRDLDAIPLGADVTLPWHMPLAEAQRALRAAGAMALESDGQPTARVRWGDWTLKAVLEFSEGLPVGDDTWLPDHPHARFTPREGGSARMLPRLRAATVALPAIRRENWRRSVALLGRPSGKAEDGSWCWRFPRTEVTFLESEPGQPDQQDLLRFASTAASRLLEVRNQTPLDLFDQLRVRVDFRAGTWEMGEPPRMRGVPVRLHWDTPRAEPLLITATTPDAEVSVEVGQHATRVLLASDGRGGVRILG